jgi:Holliday junction resolvase RusA-like endonuclease
VNNVLFISGRLPSMNDMIAAAKGFGGSGYGYSKLKKQWTDTVALLARAHKLTPVQRCRLRFDWCEAKPSKTCKSRDPDNIAAGGRKVVLDGLVAAGVLPDDSAKYVLGWVDTFAVGMGGGPVGVKVTLEALP